MKSFQETLRETIINRCDPKLDRKDVLVDVFKSYTAKMLEQNVLVNKNRLEATYLNMVKAFMISEFRSAELGEWQMSEKQYDNLFNETIQEIFNDASHAHEGHNSATMSSEQLEINKEAYADMKMTEGGLWMPPTS